MDPLLLKRILEAVLMAAAQPLSLSQLAGLFTEEEAVDNDQIGAALAALAEDCAERGIELKEVASGFRYQIREDVHAWVTRLWTERQTKYSRALLETLALIAYRQPITRAEIEQIRGVAVSSSIIKTLEEREWVRVVGYRDVPGRPALFGTSRNFLDYFNLKSLDELPPLAEIRDLDEYDPQMDLAPVIPPSLELPPEDQEAMAAEAAAETAAAGGEPGAETAVTDEASADQAAAEAGAEPASATDDDHTAAAGEDRDGDAAQPAGSAEAGPLEAGAGAAEAPAMDDAAEAAAPHEAGISAEAAGEDEANAEADASAMAGTAEETIESAHSGEAETEAPEASRESGDSGSGQPAAGPRGSRKPSPAPSAPDPDGDFAAGDFEDAPEADTDWSAAGESALDSDDTPDFADSDFSPDDDVVDPPETTTSDDVPEHNA
ncbi:SMC-Scp complex subunit ScpB [Tahibacter harae]|uniref:SMC-Scp complex subunit ScpB n=1 Tax=Tahibacter harae TaxID=2963937 RepID=A0ABT1QVI1_9GAMM|nr:SMC-Scp complex subunit ScpB [Tahibacter harae]MCQ4166302.1 SMC-Scp complex subunit ScpB [Tahibacter harae]